MRLLFVLLRIGALAMVLLVGGFYVLKSFFGLRVETAGTGMTPIFSFHDPEAHYAAIEAERRSPPPASRTPETQSAPTPGTGAAPGEELIDVPAGAPIMRPAEAGPEAEALLIVAAHSKPAAYWTDYRGPRRDGVYNQTALRLDWDAEAPTELWRQKVGGGYASMVVAEGRVFTIEQRRSQEVAAAYGLSDGKQVWEHRWPGLFEESMGGNGPRATPTWNDGALYVLGALGDLRRLSAENGELIWKTNILADAGAGNIAWGMSGAPLVVDGKVIVFPGGRTGKSVIAYDKDSGKPIWTSQDDKAGYASPQTETLAGMPQLLLFSGRRIAGLALDDGSLLWDYPWPTSHDINAAQPIAVDGDHLWISSGYGHGAALLRIEATGDSYAAELVWEKNTMKNKFNSSVLYDNHVYGLDDSILACIDVRTGERKWKGGRYGFGQLLLADGHVIVLTEKGDLVLVKATPESHQEIARFGAIDGKTWNVPAIADGVLLVRNQTEMVAYDLRR